MLVDALNTILKYTLASHEDFHKAIHTEPAEQTHHLVYADWLQENGHEEAAEHIRKAVADGEVAIEPHFDIGGDAEPVEPHVPVAHGDGGKWRGIGQDGGWETFTNMYSRSAHDPDYDIRWTHPKPWQPDVEPDQYSTLEDALKYTLADEGDFHDAIHKEPADGTNALVYAGWLEDQGKEAHAQLLHQHVEANGTGGTPADSTGRPPLHATATVVPRYDFNRMDSGDYEPSDYTVHLTQVSPDGKRSLNWRTGSVDRASAFALHKRLVAEGAKSELSGVPDLSTAHLERVTGREVPVGVYETDEQPVRYAAVPAHDVHPDYAPSGIAPRIGHLLNRIASENSDAGALAEGIVRTGDHSLLKILADKLADDGHDLRSHTDGGAGPDLRHAERGIKIDRAVGHWLERVRDQHFQGMYPHFNQPANWVSRYLENKERFPRLNRQAAVKELKQVVPDATKDDFHHSLMRHIDNEDIRYLHTNSQTGTRGYVDDGNGGFTWTSLPDHMEAGVQSWAQTLHNSRLAKLGTGTPDAHQYPDTRPANKRYRLSDLVAKYRAVKYELDADSLHNRLIEKKYAVGPAIGYADWLQGQGKDAHAELVRSHVKASGRGPLVHKPDAVEKGVKLNPAGEGLSTVRMAHPVTDLHTLNWESERMPTGKAQELASRLEKEQGPVDKPVKYSHEAFEQAIHNEPEENIHPLVYADWLQEHDKKPAHAEFIRSAIGEGEDNPYRQILELVGSHTKGHTPFGLRAWDNGDGTWQVNLHSHIHKPDTDDKEMFRRVSWNRDMPVAEAKSAMSKLVGEGATVLDAGTLEELGIKTPKNQAVHYAIHKAPANGMVKKESPLAVTGAFITGGRFVDLDPQPVAQPAPPPAKTVTLSSLLKKLRARKTGK